MSSSDRPTKAAPASGQVQPVVPVVPITSDLLIYQARDEAGRRKPAGSGKSLEEQIRNYMYEVGPYDVLSITVWDHPELTIPAGSSPPQQLVGNTVRSDGTIFYPYVGIVHVAGKNVEEIRRIITRKLVGYIENPQVGVRVATFRSQKVFVTGEVAHPSPLPITDVPMTVLDALNIAGGGNPAADLQHVRLVHADGSAETINLLALLEEGDTSQNQLLRDGDSLHVPSNEFNKVFVIGEVNKPGSLPLIKGYMTLAEALSDAEGVNMNTSDPGKIFVIRGGEPVSDDAAAAPSGGAAPASDDAAIYLLDADSPDAFLLADQFRLQPRDVVFVSTAQITRWGRVLNNLSSTIQALSIARLFSRGGF